MEHRVVGELPHAAAHQRLVGVDLAPVVLDAAGAHPHGMRILAEQVRAVVEAARRRAALAHAPHAVDRGIHLAAHVVGTPKRVDGALVVDGQVGARADELVHGVGVAAAARLVAQAPHDHARVGLVALEQALGAVEVARLPARVVREAVLTRGELAHQGAVRLEVGLVDHIDAQLVAELEQVRVGRVVRRADGVDVVLLAEAHVALDLRRPHRVAGPRGRVVVVDAVQLDGAAVHEEAPPVHAGLAEARAQERALGARLDDEVVEAGRLRGPLEHVEAVEGHGRATAGRARRGGALKPVAAQRDAHLAVRREGDVDLKAVAHATRAFFSARPHVNVPDAAGGHLAQQHVAEDAVVAEHVLAFEIGARAPAPHHGDELVYPGALVGREVKLRRVVGALGIAHALAVEVEVQAARDAEEGDDVPDGRLALVQTKETPVDADEVVLVLGMCHVRAPALAADEREDRAHRPLLGDARRVKRELVALVHVERAVVALELPAARHGDAVPRHGPGVKHVGKLGGAREEPEVPLPAQAAHERRLVAPARQRHRLRRPPVRIRDEIAPRRQTVLSQHCRIRIRGPIEHIPHRVPTLPVKALPKLGGPWAETAPFSAASSSRSEAV